ncbi:hypothetical protein Bhyg_01410, partial [Pseudolycoriella hygida]
IPKAIGKEKAEKIEVLDPRIVHHII